MAANKRALIMLMFTGAATAAIFTTARWSYDQRQEQNESIAFAAEPVASSALLPTASNAEASMATAERDATLGLPTRSYRASESKADPFATLSWLPPVVVVPVRAVPPPKPPAPVAPPLPFAFVGMLESGAAKPQAFLAKGESLIIVSAGEMIDNNTYRVESVNSQQIAITYLPLNTVQTLNVSGATQ